MAKRGNGEGTITRRKDGRWAGGLRLENGDRKWVYGKTRREVQRKLDAAKFTRALGHPLFSASEHVGAYLERWLKIKHQNLGSERTADAYDLNIRRAGPYLGQLSLDALKPAHLQDCYTNLLVQGRSRGHGGLSAQSVLGVHRTLHEALRDAVRWELVGRNVADAVTPPRPVQALHATLTVDQVGTLFATTRGDRWHALWVLIVTTGLRHGEATGLKWSDVDFERGTLMVRRQLQPPRNGRDFSLCKPKTKQSERTLPLPPITVAALRSHKVKQAEERLAAGTVWDARTEFQGLVFCSTTGSPLDPGRGREALYRALAAVGLPRVRVHELRHTAATLLFTEDNAHPQRVRALLGHSTIALTMNTYTHVLPSDLRPVADTMQRLFGEGQEAS
jgi:integrase